MDSEGIYRVSGFADEIEALKMAFDKGNWVGVWYLPPFWEYRRDVTMYVHMLLFNWVLDTFSGS